MFAWSWVVRVILLLFLSQTACAAQLVTRIVDQVSGAQLSGLVVDAYEKSANGDLLWKAKRTTDAEGLVSFDLDGLGAGRTYVLKAVPYGYAATSDDIVSTGSYRFWVGKLQVRVVDGTTGQAKAGQTLSLRRWQSDGNHAYVTSVTTDAQGWVRLDPANFGTDSYVFTATSQTDGLLKTSARYSDKGPHTFSLGNPAVVALVRDAQSGSALSGKTVEVFEKLANGSRALVLTRQTDAAGQARFDLDGVGSGRQYVLRTQPYEQAVESADIVSAGTTVLPVGKLQVSVIDGRTDKAFAWQDVHLMERSATGAMRWVAKFRTDGEGKVRLDPPDLGTKAYALRAISSVDGSNKDSGAFTQAGIFQFKVGGAGLVARLVDQVDGAQLAGVAVDAYEKNPDGSLVWKAARTTDSAGLISFDLDGLGSGRIFVLKTSPYGFGVTSDEIHNTGSYRFWVGKLRVSLVDGRNGSAFADRDVHLMERSPSGVLTWVAKYRTDVQGNVRIDPPSLGTKAYVLRAVSPVDGSNKDSSVYTQPGTYEFRVGGAGLIARVVDQVSGAQLSGLAVDAYEKSANGDLLWKAKRTTDAEGLVSFDLDGLGAGRTYVLKAVPYGYAATSDDIVSTGSYRFWVGKLQVRVVDGTTGQAKAGQTLSLRRWQSDGNHAYVTSVTTDAQGWVRLDPANFGTDSYVFTATSQTDGLLKTSARYSDKGPHTFSLGNPAVVALVRDAQSGSALSGKTVEVFEKLANGSRALVLTRQTDAAGQARFDLDGVGSGRQYVLRTQPYEQAVESADIVSAGTTVLPVGKLQVSVIDGRTDKAFAWQDVHLMERSATGAMRWVAKFRTDGEGKVRLDPPDLGTKAYALRAISSVDGSNKDSGAFTQAGIFQFKVGGAGVLIRLVDHVTDAFLPGQEVHAYRQGGTGTYEWVAQKTTDAEGLVKFDFDDIGSGAVYQFKAKPYGYWTISDAITTGGGYRLRAGTLPVVLSDRESLAVIPRVPIQAFEKLPNGVLVPAVQGMTDGNGLLRLDLDGLGSGREYVLLATNPFGDGENHYSRVIAARGPLAFSVMKGAADDLDRSPPSINILDPNDAVSVASGGVRISGRASDAEGLRDVIVTITLPGGEVIEKVGTWRPESGAWYVHTGSLGAVPGEVKVAARARDNAYNEAEASITLKLIRDTSPPTIVVTSHASGSTVPTGGFLVTGHLSDDTIGGSLRVSLTGGGLAAPLTQQVEVAQSSGSWSVVLTPEERFTGSLALELIASDNAGNESRRSLSVATSDTYEQVWHLLLRTSFGPEPAAYLAAVRAGASSVLQAQISASGMEDEGFATRAAHLPPGLQISTDFVRHAIYGDQQLREVMTWFWDNHFNTNYHSHSNSDFERRENEAFRLNALGNFRALLGISASSPAMLYTLDGRFSNRAHPNENYARELMELHTMGVDGGYTQRDIEEIARAFTGWTVINGSFGFDANVHDAESKSMLGMTIAAGGGQSEGERVLDLLAAHVSTAGFICRKLVTYFVADVPIDGLSARCAQTFRAHRESADQIAQVLSTILTSPEFMGTSYRRAKIKTPLEFVIGAVRQLGGEAAGDDIVFEVQRQGMALFMNPSPTGYTDLGNGWVSSSMLQTRARFADRLMTYWPSSSQTRIGLAQLMADEGHETSEAVAGRMLERLFGPTFTRRHRQLALDVLTEEGAYPYAPDSPDAELRLRRLGKALMVLPEYHLQ